jgi:membrane protein
MAEESTRTDLSESGRASERDQALIIGPGEIEKVQAPAAGWSKPRTLQDRVATLRNSAAGRYWAHLSATDFMNSSFAFAALAVLSAFPFLAVSSAAVGGDVRKAIAALTWVSAIVLVLGMIGMASTMQTWYHRIYDQTPPRGVFRHLLYQVAGIVAFTAYISFEVWLFEIVRPAGGRGLIFLLTFVFAVLFWWGSAYMLLYRRVPLRQLFPAGLATGACITGLGVVSSFVFSDQVTSGQESYGPAGVVLVLISFLVGFGVCLHAGAVFGRMWNEWQAERASLDTRGGRDQRRHDPAAD